MNHKDVLQFINNKSCRGTEKAMTTPALPRETVDQETTFLRDNKRKKTYAEAIQDATMQEERQAVSDSDQDELDNQDEDAELMCPLDEAQLGEAADQPEDPWEIQLTPELKNQLAGPWKTSVILKLMGRPLGYRALQTRLAGIWRPTGTMHLIDLGYGFFIMRFAVIKDYHHALMDGSWFVGDQYMHVQAWEADFHPQIAKITTTAVWIWLEQLPIEYYHPEFLKHVGNKLGKLLKIDAITNAAIRGRYARVCVQMNTTHPLPKRVRIGSFWQDIVYENLHVLCFHCGRIGHRETHCTESMKLPHTDL